MFSLIRGWNLVLTAGVVYRDSYPAVSTKSVWADSAVSTRSVWADSAVRQIPKSPTPFEQISGFTKVW